MAPVGGVVGGGGLSPTVSAGIDLIPVPRLNLTGSVSHQPMAMPVVVGTTLGQLPPHQVQLSPHRCQPSPQVAVAGMVRLGSAPQPPLAPEMQPPLEPVQQPPVVVPVIVPSSLEPVQQLPAVVPSSSAEEKAPVSDV